MSLTVTSSKKCPDLEIRIVSNMYVYAGFLNNKGKENSEESNLVTDLEREQCQVKLVFMLHLNK